MDLTTQKILTSIIASLTVAIIIFLFKRNFFQTKDINGEWDLRIKILKSSYNPYIGLQIDYKVHLLLQDNKITGRGEKVRDIKSDGDLHYEYPHKDRATFTITGNLEKNYFRPSKINLQITETGTERTTSSSYYLIIKNRNYLEGNFESTAADSKGEATWTRLDKSYK